MPYSIDYPCNWLQVAENPMDPFHSVFLHTRVTRAANLRVPPDSPSDGPHIH